MGKPLAEIAQDLKASTQKVQLIYAFNGTGKTRLSREFKKELEKEIEAIDDDSSELSHKNILYYNAFTEDLFYWDNDLNGDEDRKLKIHPNRFTKWILEDQGQDQNIIEHFQRLTSSTVMPAFNAEYTTKDQNDQDVVVKAFSEVSFSQGSGEQIFTKIKISKGEESNLIWSVFYSLLEQVIEELNTPDPIDRSTESFDNLKYVFIDDPVSSLDENHLIQLAVDLAELIKSSDYTGERGLKFIITTHNPLFYNVLHNALNLSKRNRKDGCYLLERFEDGTFDLNVKFGDSNKSFSYHLHLKRLLEHATENNQVERYHFMLLRNLYEKTASFLGFPEWGDLLESAPGDKQGYLNRIIQFTSHSTISNEAIAEPTPQEKQMVKLLLDNLVNNYSYWKLEAQND
ncbi:AAA family ATPase [Shewanella sp. VB17]|uniref:AAA family ATPase n=1 Tax=Shewanella sp. VB17 TaxID=2739432 RepID=UPI001564F35F|nr:AAA family ATPase [Shewanella sp. VB17]NRD75439.1 AAA family ATPase [Shewanella sp. VB17]